MDSNFYIQKQLINSKNYKPLVNTHYTITLSEDLRYSENLRIKRGITDENGFMQKHDLKFVIGHEIFIAVNMRSLFGDDYSLYTKHESYAITELQGNNWQTGIIYVNPDQWSGWVFNGDCTATGEPGATLWGLAELITGNGNDWKRLKLCHAGKAEFKECLTIDYSDLTVCLHTRILIVAGSVHDKPDIENNIKSHLKNTLRILNPQNVPVSFDFDIRRTENKNIAGSDILRISTVLHEENPTDSLFNMTMIGYLCLTKIYDKEELIGFDDPSTQTLYLLYTDAFIDRDTRNNIYSAGMTLLTDLPRMILTKHISEATIAHELCHIFGLQHDDDVNNLMYHVSSIRTNTGLKFSQVNRIKTWLANYLKNVATVSIHA